MRALLRYLHTLGLYEFKTRRGIRVYLDACAHVGFQNEHTTELSLCACEFVCSFTIDSSDGETTRFDGFVKGQHVHDIWVKNVEVCACVRVQFRACGIIFVFLRGKEMGSERARGFRSRVSGNLSLPFTHSLSRALSLSLSLSLSLILPLSRSLTLTLSLS